jgi:hypothetical protein
MVCHESASVRTQAGSTSSSSERQAGITSGKLSDPRNIVICRVDHSNGAGYAIIDLDIERDNSGGTKNIKGARRACCANSDATICSNIHSFRITVIA